MEHARKIWEELDLPALAPQPPWHGYTLGDWNDTWETYAKRAVTGAWEQSGKETLAQKRGGLKPETPVRDADKGGDGGH
jgi:4-hydroxy-3-polyprenylbenzoate decarboxylase